MNINTDSSIYSSMMAMLQSAQNTGASGTTPPPPPPPPGMGDSNLDISAIGQQLSQLSDDDKSALQDFLQKIRDAASSGNFDASALASQAPDFVKQMTDDQGVSMTDLVTALANGNASGSDMPPPPPPPMNANGSNGQPSPMSSSDMQSVLDFHKQVQAAAADGDFDVESLADSAPDAVVNMAQQQGVDVTDLVNWMAQNDPPPAPQGSGQAQGAGSDLASLFQQGNSSSFSLAQILTQFAQS